MNDCWKWNGKSWERRCPTCDGSGRETLRQSGKCSCPWGLEAGQITPIHHPDNDDSHGISNRLNRCNKCGAVWRIYFEATDDSWDVPKPDLIGYEIPDVEWRFTGVESSDE